MSFLRLAATLGYKIDIADKKHIGDVWHDGKAMIRNVIYWYTKSNVFDINVRVQKAKSLDLPLEMNVSLALYMLTIL